VHGWAEHSGRYEHVGAWFAARACAVHAYDHRGHGRSDGPRGHARRFEDLLDDLELALARVRAQDPGLPVFLVGHSMGGLLVASFLVERAPEIAGAVTSGAALALADAPPRARLALLRLLGRVVPRLAVARPIATEALSRDPEVGRAYLDDPLVLHRMTLGFGAGLLTRVARTAGAAARVRVPMLLLHGGDDPLCPAEGSRRFFAELGTPTSDLRIYPGLRHEIFNEPEREAVFADLLAWLRDVSAARLGSPALVSAPSPSARAGEAGLAG
jgi:alpha-beta hydrolase superfamily lysophospholipase